MRRSLGATSPVSASAMPDIGEAADGVKRLGAHRGPRVERRQSQHEHHRHQDLSAERKRPAAVAGDEPGRERDRADRDDFADRRRWRAESPEVESSESEKPVRTMRAFTRNGPGKSLMLAPIAPSVAG